MLYILPLQEYNKTMKCLSFKKISLLFFTLVLMSNVFATNTQTFSTDPTTCVLEKFYTHPCIMVSIGDIDMEIEQETDFVSSIIYSPLVEFEYISLVQKHIAPQKINPIAYHPTDLSPPERVQLPRSHIIIS